MVLNAWDAIFRIQPHRKVRPKASHLRGPGHLNLLTVYGAFDLPATIGDGLTNEDLLAHTVEVKIAESVRMRILDL